MVQRRASQWSVVVALAFAAVAHASPRFDASLEGSATAPVGATSSSFSVGGGFAARARLSLVGPLRLQVGGGFASLPSRGSGELPGNALWGGAGVRVVLLEGAPGSWWGGLWLDTQANVVGTGPNVRFGYELGLGADARLRWPFGVGPFVRFLQIVDSPGDQSASAFLLSFGVSVGLGDFPRGDEATRPPPRSDGDGDGLFDDVDRCPAQPETVNGYQDDDGCPDTPPVESTTHIEIKQPAAIDRDGDGFVDEQDRCPEQPEVFNGNADDDGCPDAGEALVALTEDRLVLQKPVKFTKVKSGWQVAKGSLPMLAAAAVVLSLHVDIKQVRIEARAEKQATREATAELSTKRAQAVKQALVEMGLDGARLEATGVGGDKDGVELVLVR